MLPGTTSHQQMLQTIIDFYNGDERILAILLFGSLGRGDWDTYSDLDLDIVMANDVLIDAQYELSQLCTNIKQQHNYDAIILADNEEGDVVLSNLLKFSIRYHILSDPKPAILDYMRLLSGNLTLGDVRNGVNTKYHTTPPTIEDQVNQCFRYALELRNAILRERIWMSLEFLHRIRGILMALYSLDQRHIHFFDAHATPELQVHLGTLVPLPNLDSIQEAYENTLSILTNHLDSFIDEDYHLTEAQNRILQQLTQSTA